MGRLFTGVAGHRTAAAPVATSGIAMPAIAGVVCLLAALVGCGTAGPDPLGVGELIAFVPLGPGVEPHTDQVELHGTGGRDLFDTLENDGASNLDEARTALAYAPAEGSRAFAFVQGGCANTGAVLVLSNEHLSARLTGGENTDCAMQEYFLATFRIPAELVPEHSDP